MLVVGDSIERVVVQVMICRKRVAREGEEMYQLARSTRDEYWCAICGAVVKEKGADKYRGDLGKVSRTHVSCGGVRSMQISGDSSPEPEGK